MPYLPASAEPSADTISRGASTRASRKRKAEEQGVSSAPAPPPPQQQQQQQQQQASQCSAPQKLTKRKASKQQQAPAPVVEAASNVWPAPRCPAAGQPAPGCHPQPAAGGAEPAADAAAGGEALQVALLLKLAIKGLPGQDVCSGLQACGEAGTCLAHKAAKGRARCAADGVRALRAEALRWPLMATAACAPGRSSRRMRRLDARIMYNIIRIIPIKIYINMNRYLPGYLRRARQLTPTCHGCAQAGSMPCSAGLHAGTLLWALPVSRPCSWPRPTTASLAAAQHPRAPGRARLLLGR